MMETEPARTLIRRVKAMVERGRGDWADAPLEVPLSYYRDREQWQWEVEDLLPRTPIVVSASAMVPNAHDYRVEDVLGRSLLVTRAGDGRCHVFLNYCRHRGALLADGCGSARRHTCPYHGWAYDSEGTLAGIPCRDAFATVTEDQSGLVELPAEERYGLVFCVLDPTVPLELDAHLGGLWDELAQWPYQTGWLARSASTVVEANWKAVLDAFAETYHFPYVHPESVNLTTIPNVMAIDTWGPHHRMTLPMVNILEYSDDIPDKRISLVSHTAPIYWVYPNLFLGNEPFGAQYINVLPADDVNRSVVQYASITLAPPKTEEEQELYVANFEFVFNAIRTEDTPVLGRCGRGLARAAAPNFLVGRNEPLVQHMVTVLSNAYAEARSDGPSEARAHLSSIQSPNAVRRAWSPRNVPATSSG